MKKRNVLKLRCTNDIIKFMTKAVPDITVCNELEHMASQKRCEKSFKSHLYRKASTSAFLWILMIFETKKAFLYIKFLVVNANSF